MAVKQIKELKESDIEESILIYLDSIGSVVWKIAPSGFVMKDNRGVRMRMHKSPYARRKTLDIFCLYKGKFIAIEVKTEKVYKYIIKHWDKLKREYPLMKKGQRKHYAQQVFTVEKINNNGGYAMFACSVEQIKAFIGNLKQEGL